MFDAGKLLGALMQGGLNEGGSQRIQSAVGNMGGIGGLLSSVTGGSGGSGVMGAISGLMNGSNSGNSSTSGGLMGGLTGLLGGGANSNGTGGGIMGTLSGLMGGATGSGVLGGSAMGMLGAMALQAFQKAGNSSSETLSAPMQLLAGLREPENESERTQVHNMGLLTIRAMINAAKADGEVDADELQRISGKVNAADAGEEASEFVRNALSQPMETAAIVSAVTNPQMAAQIYTASLLAINVDTDAEKSYLSELAEELKLDKAVIAQIHSMLGVEL